MVDPRSPLYAWEQIRDAVRLRIDDGTYPDRLPAEVDLSAEFDVSRETVRKALKALIDDGLIVSIRGRGYFVTKRG
ncbi:GntR family transcriptional regulator [Actinocatenispora sera]|uniref:GntR family transcriptional regulator n=1 Tax=Actinocatenispora sera TaxID=390989 RepID=UPI00340BC6F9